MIRTSSSVIIVKKKIQFINELEEDINAAIADAERDGWKMDTVSTIHVTPQYDPEFVLATITVRRQA